MRVYGHKPSGGLRVSDECRARGYDSYPFISPIVDVNLLTSFESVQEILAQINDLDTSSPTTIEPDAETDSTPITTVPETSDEESNETQGIPAFPFESIILAAVLIGFYLRMNNNV